MVSKHLDDKLLLAQASWLKDVSDCWHIFRTQAGAWYESPKEEERRLNEKVGRSFIRLQQSLDAASKAEKYGVDFQKMFDGTSLPKEIDVPRLTHVDSTDVLGPLVDTVRAFNEERLKTWAAHAEKLRKLIVDACPTGWVPDGLLRDDEANAARRDALMKNPRYKLIGPAVSMLTDIDTGFEEIKKYTDGSIITAELLKSCKQAVATGTDTVTFTFLIFNLKVKVPEIKDKQTRHDLLKDVINQVKPKIQLTQNYAVYVQALKQCEDPMEALRQADEKFAAQA